MELFPLLHYNVHVWNFSRVNIAYSKLNITMNDVVPQQNFPQKIQLWLMFKCVDRNIIFTQLPINLYILLFIFIYI